MLYIWCQGNSLASSGNARLFRCENDIACSIMPKVSQGHQNFLKCWGSDWPLAAPHRLRTLAAPGRGPAVSSVAALHVCLLPAHRPTLEHAPTRPASHSAMSAQRTPLTPLGLKPTSGKPAHIARWVEWGWAGVGGRPAEERGPPISGVSLEGGRKVVSIMQQLPGGNPAPTKQPSSTA